MDEASEAKKARGGDDMAVHVYQPNVCIPVQNKLNSLVEVHSVSLAWQCAQRSLAVVWGRLVAGSALACTCACTDSANGVTAHGSCPRRCSCQRAT